MIEQETLAKWWEWAKRDDACKLFVPSDIRQMIREIERLWAEQERDRRIKALQREGWSYGEAFRRAELPKG